MLFLSTPSARRATSVGAANDRVEIFLSTPSARRATATVHTGQGRLLSFLSTPSARRATRKMRFQPLLRENFYPRPPRGGRRAKRISRIQWRRHFYPRPPRGGRPNDNVKKGFSPIFLSTPSARRATYCCTVDSQPPGFLSTPSARRATFVPISSSTEMPISIHALREEGDQRHQPCHHAGGISIHALREEGDWEGHAAQAGGKNFYPRPPRGGRQ